MSDSGKDTVAPKEKDGAEKRGRGRPRKHPPQVLHCFIWGVLVFSGPVYTIFHIDETETLPLFCVSG